MIYAISPRFFFISILLILVGCDSGSSDGAHIQIDPQGKDRQILALNENTLVVDVVVNNGLPQSYSIAPNQSRLPVLVQGVIPGQINTFNILWSEILNGVPVELAEQTQQLIVDSNTIIDAPHFTAQFDYDNDGRPNLAERIEGTCVWTSTEICLEEGFSDVPGSVVATASGSGDGVVPVEQLPGPANIANIPVTVTAEGQATIDNADNILPASNFANGVGEWFANDPIAASPGQICVSLDIGSPSQQFFLMANAQLFEMPVGDYAVQFDARANRPVALAISITKVGTSSVVYDRYIDGGLSTDWQTITQYFTVTTQTPGPIGFGFNALTDIEVTQYCFDNLKLVRL